MNDFLKSKTILKDMDEIYARNLNWNEFDGKTVYISGSYGMLASYMVYFFIYLNEIKGISINILAQGRNEEKARRKFGIYFKRDYFRYISENIVSEDCETVSEADYVIHAAGLANPRFYGTNPVEVIEPNAIGTYELLRHCDKNRLKGFLFLSTCDVYGSVEDCEHITEDTVGKVDPLDAHSCYSESKRLAETLLSAYNKEYGLRTVIARVGHTYGPTMDLENDPRVFASLMNDAVNGRNISLHSDGSAVRAFCYLSDAVAAYLLLLLSGVPGEAYNVTNTDQMISIRDVASIMASLPENQLEVSFEHRNEKDTYLRDKINKQNKPLENKIIELGWHHDVDAREGFFRVYKYFTEDVLTP